MQKSKTSGIFCLFAIIIALFAVLIICGFMAAPKGAVAYAASEAELDGAEQEPAQSLTAPTDNSEGAAPKTFLSRVQEWFERNLSEFFSGATLVTAFSTVTAVIVSWRKNKKLKAATDALLAGVSEKTDNNTEINGKVIKAINELIAKYNAVQEYIVVLDKKELTRDAVCEEMATFGKTILEILATVYANNKNIPQGVKDLVTLKYSQALRTEDKVLALAGSSEPSEPIQSDDSGGEE